MQKIFYTKYSSKKAFEEKFPIDCIIQEYTPNILAFEGYIFSYATLELNLTRHLAKSPL